jgi:glycosyltransferase involved in cell wall biosynthesis
LPQPKNPPDAVTDEGASDFASPDAAGSPKVTAVIPAYNMAAYIERALRSAIGQTYANLDILVIDDGSGDDTARIAQAIAERHANVRVVTTENAGVAAARNLGTQMADSLYVAYLDADDLWHPLKIERQVAALAAHGHSVEWGSCYTLYRMIDPDDAVIDDGVSSHERGDFFAEHLVWNPVGNGSNLLVRRDLALAVEGFNPDYAAAGIGGCEDLEFQLKLLLRSKMELVREFLVGYRLHAAQMSGDIVMMRLSKLAVIETIVAGRDMPPATRKRALVQAYLTLAKGHFLMGSWGAAAKSIVAGLAAGPIETARKFEIFLRQELDYWTARSRHQLQSSARPPGVTRPFGEFAPGEGVDADSRNRVRHRNSLASRRKRS